MHKVGVLAMHGVVAYDLAIPCEVFARVVSGDGCSAYRVMVCGEAEEVRAGAFGIRAPYGLDSLASADTIVIPGVEDPSAPVPTPVLDAIGGAWANGARVLSICTGSFVLASTGLLDGMRATTHWLGVRDFTQRFPRVELDPGVLFVDAGRIVTSAGSSAGLDMCLHVVRKDHGQAAAAHAARLAVAPLDRDGGQAQFIRHEPPGSAGGLAPLLGWMAEHAAEALDVDALAARARMSPRTFARRFREQTGTTPGRHLARLRVRRAQELLETTSDPIERVATASGFESPVTFRTRFQKIVGVSPATYRRRFNAA